MPPALIDLLNNGEMDGDGGQRGGTPWRRTIGVADVISAANRLFEVGDGTPGTTKSANREKVLDKIWEEDDE